jgi:hypothetical protein
MNTSDRWEPTGEEIEEIVSRHETWLETNHEEGEKANLVGADLSNVDLRNRNLREAELGNISNLRVGISGLRLPREDGRRRTAVCRSLSAVRRPPSAVVAH